MTDLYRAAKEVVDAFDGATFYLPERNAAIRKLREAVTEMRQKPPQPAGADIKADLITAARQALEAMNYSGMDIGKFNRINAACAALSAALAEPAEPVAWRTFDGEGGYDYRDYEMNENYDKEWAQRNPRHAGWVEPLYTAPAPRKPDELVEALRMIEALSPYADDVNSAHAIARAALAKVDDAAIRRMA